MGIVSVGNIKQINFSLCCEVEPLHESTARCPSASFIHFKHWAGSAGRCGRGPGLGRPGGGGRGSRPALPSARSREGPPEAQSRLCTCKS